jgi:hypothetical protein
MKLRWRRSSESEEAFEIWLRQHYQELVLSGRGLPPSGPCADDAFLQDLARKSRHIRLSDPRVEHAASCPICMRKLLEFRRSAASPQRQVALAFGVGCCLLIAVWGISRVAHVATRKQAGMNALTVTRMVDLSSTGTFRGEQPSQLPSVSLPKNIVKLRLILPRFSKPGVYAVNVARTQSDDDLVAHATGPSKRDGQNEQVSVLLDLRSVRPGQYFLSTKHEQDDAWYYYPIQVQ